MRSLCLPLLLLCSGFATARDADLTEAYRRAERFLPGNVLKLVAHAYVAPNWAEDESGFWYLDNRFGQRTFRWVDVKRATDAPAFDHEKLAKALAKAGDLEVDPQALPFRDIEVSEDRKSISFSLGAASWRWQTETHELVMDEEKDEQRHVVSPDGHRRVFVRDHNLYVHDHRKDKERALTEDGAARFGYGFRPSWYAMQPMGEPDTQGESEGDISASWSPDGTKMISIHLDRRKAKKLYLFQSTPEEGFRAKVWGYERALPVDDQLSTQSFVLFDLKKGTRTPVDMVPQPAYLEWSLPVWSKDGKKLLWPRWKRAFRGVDLVEIDAETGKIRVLLEETSETFVDTNNHQFRLLQESGDILWLSERSGWQHIYRIDGKTGAIKNAVTRGAWVVNRIAQIDEAEGWVTFTASGVEKDQDPYYRRLYKVGLDGNDLTCLTPEPGNHYMRFSPDHRYFVDNLSEVHRTPSVLLRRTRDGKTLKKLAEADIQPLLTAGWVPPEPFRVKARDGKTDLYGLLYKPADFDPNHKYPVIDGTYSGPHAVYTPKSFVELIYRQEQALANLGFIVINVDGMGTSGRGKVFHDFSYKNLGDVGAPDHIGAMRQLAETRPWMDLDRVGIYGHSAGGYDTVRAMLTHPDFYKVGVSSAGNHDHRMAKIWWPELWMGEQGSHYDEQSNLTLADRLKGRLLLVHGDMDNNVNPAATLRLAGELIKHNKDFDLLLIPNKRHLLNDDPYFLRKRWDYFVTHLQGKTPPAGYRIELSL
ncbi:DPP IV N-terminal domain-containing protein [Sulfidibacter corallicola]|uniref:DPP IV N-terminal domain-containing protein n=1 Tax=Sulfidibacter corallicola TaxID=2818388 RepID=A0A8A4TQQ0_SULCO|nr:DPP IV N-terminal domain-containing protein [Sulfidibacter corallicola]QTD48865.1 DPP IV N-terminal domain-containing protein [Sulfidibacter corallicola]